MRLGDVLRHDRNNFDLLRLLATLAVMFGHGAGIVGAFMEPGLRLTHRESSASLAVYAFFLTSGLLVSASYARSSQIRRFAVLRIGRIWPAAVICALLSTLLIAPLFNLLSWGAYFQSAATWHAVFKNCSLLGEVKGLMPGVFPGNHLAGMLLPNYWTLPIELECYVLVALLGGFGIYQRHWLILPALLLVGALFAIGVWQQPQHLKFAGAFLKQRAYSFYPVPFFLLGMLLYGWREHVRISGWPALLGCMMWYVLRDTTLGHVLLYPVFACVVLWFAATPWLHRLRPRHDLSYGIYLYGFPIQQVSAALWPHLHYASSLAVAVALTLLCAAASWRYVESPVLARLRRGENARAALASSGQISTDSAAG